MKRDKGPRCNIRNRHVEEVARRLFSALTRPSLMVLTLLTANLLSSDARANPKAQTLTHKAAIQEQCPSRTLALFAEAFSTSEAVQSAFTKFPLRKQELDLSAQPEPRPHTKWLTRTQVAFPVLPLLPRRAAEGLSIRIEALGTRTGKVLLFKQDTGYLVKYHFRLSSCWELVAIEDWSV